MAASSQELSRSSRRRGWLRLAPVGLVLLVAACGWFGDDPPVADAAYNVVASAPVAGGWLLVEHPGGELVSVTAQRSGLIVRHNSSGDSSRIAWVGDALTGVQLQLGFEETSESWQGATIASAHGYRSLEEPLSAGVFSLQALTSLTSGQQSAPTLGSLSLAGLDDALEASFADFALGDVDASGALDVRDALLARRIALGDSSGTPREQFLADVDGDYDIDADDVVALLEKLTDPNLPARLVVKPRSVPFVRLDSDNQAAGEAIVLLGNGGNQPLSGVQRSDPGVQVNESWPVPGQSAVWRLGEPQDGRWLPTAMSVTGPGGSYAVGIGHLVILVAGQSNASGRGEALGGWPETNQSDPNVRMLGNDYRWKNASEPLDTALPEQLDPVSEDAGARYSFGTRLGNLLNMAFGHVTYLIPAAKSGSCLWSCQEPPIDYGSWAVQGSDLDRGTLLGSANFRGQVAAGWQENPGAGNDEDAEAGPVNVVVWYQGESENSTDERAQYKARTGNVFNSFGSRLFGGASNARVVFVQLASDFHDGENLLHNDVAERQRQLELERAGVFMVVAHDLPRSDHIHLSAAGQRVLAERIALAIREHVFGEDVDGTGPRPTGISRSGDQVRIAVDMPLVVGVLDHSMFTVFDGPPSGTLDDLPLYGGNTIAVTKAEVTSSDPHTIVLTLAANAPATPYVRHMPPAGRSHDAGAWAQVAPHMARAAGSELPLPQFGPRSGF